MGLNERRFSLDGEWEKGAELTTWIIAKECQGAGVGPGILEYIQTKVSNPRRNGNFDDGPADLHEKRISLSRRHPALYEGVRSLRDQGRVAPNAACPETHRGLGHIRGWA
jgi:hypothetical protein